MQVLQHGICFWDGVERFKLTVVWRWQSPKHICPLHVLPSTDTTMHQCRCSHTQELPYTLSKFCQMLPSRNNPGSQCYFLAFAVCLSVSHRDVGDSSVGHPVRFRIVWKSHQSEHKWTCIPLQYGIVVEWLAENFQTNFLSVHFQCFCFVFSLVKTVLKATSAVLCRSPAVVYGFMYSSSTVTASFIECDGLGS